MNHLTIMLAAMLLLSAPVHPTEIEVKGDVRHPLQQAVPGSSLKLVDDTTFGWERSSIPFDININGHKFLMETGGGNVTLFTGVISGAGRFDFNGGGNPDWQTIASFIKGDKPNTFTGTLTLLRGTLAFGKPPGVAATSGDLVLGGGSNQAILRFDAPEQLAHASNILITGPHEGRIRIQGFDQTIGQLDLQSHGYIDLTGKPCTVHFAESASRKWDLKKTLTIQNWTSKHHLSFGSSADGLLPAQVARIGFANPADRDSGLYTARLRDDGQIVPDKKVEPINPPFEMSAAARLRRKEIYDVPGLANLTGAATPLHTGVRISVFGDSITWLNGYPTLIRESLKKGPGTAGMDIAVINRGVNGGGVLSIRDGSDKSAYIDPQHGDGKQLPFAQVIAADKADVAVVYIGINDCSWRNTAPADFEKGLQDIAAAAKANHTRLVLATVSVYHEKPDGSNPKDAACERFAEITRKVAASSGATLVDLRKAHIAYLQDENADLRVDGTIFSAEMGVLTYDGIHPNARGNELIAELIAQGIYEAMKAKQ